MGIRPDGHVSRREDECVGKRVMGMEVTGKRRRGRPKQMWLDSIRNNLSERGLSGEDAQDRPSPRWTGGVSQDTSTPC